jgi:hypothetical protein
MVIVDERQIDVRIERDFRHERVRTVVGERGREDDGVIHDIFS